MTRVYEGSLDGSRLRVAVVTARFNEAISRRLLNGALDGLRRHGVAEDEISVAWVPGAFELPATARRFASSGEVDAVVCLGTVIRGETAHFDYVAGQAAAGIADAAVATGVPVIFGVLTTENSEQANERAGGKNGNEGFEAAIAAIEMANLYSSIPKPASEL
jgi:6,7-dimethyl-8-ribityllumazine synthase